MKNCFLILALAFTLISCAASNCYVEFEPISDELATSFYVRGIGGLACYGPANILLYPVKEAFQADKHPIFIVGIQNNERKAVTVGLDNFQAHLNGKEIKILSIKDIEKEIERAANAKLFLAALFGAMSAASAENSGYTYYYGSIQGSGAYDNATFSGYVYDESKVVEEQRRATDDALLLMSVVNQQAGNTIELFKRNVWRKETILPGEQHFGWIVLDKIKEKETTGAMYICIDVDDLNYCFNFKYTRTKE